MHFVLDHLARKHTVTQVLTKRKFIGMEKIPTSYYPLDYLQGSQAEKDAGGDARLERSGCSRCHCQDTGSLPRLPDLKEGQAQHLLV